MLKKRSVLLGAVVALALVLGASAAAIAATRNCTANTPCVGTSKGDTLNGSSGPDDMHGRAGGDAMRGNGGSDEMEGGLGADRVLGGTGGDEVVWGGEQIGSAAPFTYPDKSGDNTAGGPGPDMVYGGFGQGGVDRVFGNGANDTIIVAQRGFPASDGEVKVTKEVVDCGTGEDTVFRDRGLDVIANDCEHKRRGFPIMEMAAAHEGFSVQGGLIEAASSER
jgi:Ca2+-binding RTX toxin-like protein